MPKLCQSAGNMVLTDQIMQAPLYTSTQRLCKQKNMRQQNVLRACDGVAGLVKASKVPLPENLVVVKPWKWVTRWSFGFIPKQINVGTVPQSMMPVYVPCKNGVSAANKACKKHGWHIILALVAILLLAIVIKWKPGAGVDRRGYNFGG